MNENFSDDDDSYSSGYESSICDASSLGSFSPEEVDLLENDLEECPLPEGYEYVSPESYENLASNAAEDLTFDDISVSSNSSNDDPIPKSKSIAHHYMTKNRLVFVSFDIETGGELCGIIQISAEIFRFEKDGTPSIEKETFDEYVKPPSDAYWNETACRQTHGLHADHPNIKEASSLSDVWKQFELYIDRHVGKKQRAVLVAWNGEGCDLRWIYKSIQGPRSNLLFPKQIQFFLDPLKVIKQYKTCKLNSNHSKLDNFALGEVYRYITRRDLDNQHNSLVDCQAQTLIVTDKMFFPFINKTHKCVLSRIYLLLQRNVKCYAKLNLPDQFMLLGKSFIPGIPFNGPLRIKICTLNMVVGGD